MVTSAIRYYELEKGNTQAMMKRFSVSMEEALLDKSDDYLAARSYQNRSEAVRDLIRDAFVRR